MLLQRIPEMRILPPNKAPNGGSCDYHEIPQPYWRKYNPETPVYSFIQSESQEYSEREET